MSVTVRIPTPLRQYTQQESEVVLDGKTVGEVLEKFKVRFPDAAARFFSSDSKASRFINLYLNDEDVRFLKDLETPVAEKDTLSIILAIAGGLTGADDEARFAKLRR
jgi:molybdopterin synthase sulfur carrier subunit